MSKSLRELENELGAKLLERSVQGIKLTDCGIALRARAEIIRSEFTRAADEIQQMKGGGRGNVAIAISSTVAVFALSRVVSEFRREYPLVKLNIVDETYQHASDSIRAGRLDFTIGPIARTSTMDGLSRELLFVTPMVLVVRKGHPKAAAKHLAELVMERWIFHSDGAGLSEALFEDNGIEIPDVVRCRSLAIWLPLLLESDYIMLIPQSLLRSKILDDALNAIPIAEPIPTARYFLFSNSSSPFTAPAEALANKFRRATRSLLPKTTGRDLASLGDVL